MSTRKEDTLTFIGHTDWTRLILVIDFEEILRAINVTDSKG